MWPDVVAIPAAGFHTRSKLDLVPGLMQSDPHLTGTHRSEGVLLIDAPGVRTGQGLTAEMRDVAPTILHLLGQFAGEASHLVLDNRDGYPTMPGRVLHEAFECRTPAISIPRPAPPAPVAIAAAISATEQACVESRLRDLGYLD